MTAPAAIRASDLSVGYDTETIVANAGFELAAGHVLAVVGGNGSGKTTLLKTLAGLLTPHAGSIDICGKAPGTQPRRVAYLSQHHHSNKALPIRVVDVVRTGCFPRRGLLGRLTEDDEDLVHESMARTGVADLAESPISELSGGQEQRVYLAQVLTRRADVLLLDEPTSGIDAAGRDRYLDILRDEMARGTSIVAATHDLAEALAADSVLLLARRVVAYGPPRDTFTTENLIDAFGTSLTEIDGSLLAQEVHHHREGGTPG